MGLTVQRCQSIGGWLALLLWVCGEMEYHDGKSLQQNKTYLMAARKQREARISYRFESSHSDIPKTRLARGTK